MVAAVIALGVLVLAILGVKLWAGMSVGAMHNTAARLHASDLGRDAADPVSARDYVIRDAQTKATAAR
jgi:hypothetical protein